VSTVCRRIVTLGAVACLVGGPGAVSAAGQTAGADLPPLSATPQGPDHPAAAARPAAEGGQLPDTGLDARQLALAGGALLILGLGLRLRTAPERF
jgi:hypothetical protein